MIELEKDIYFDETQLMKLALSIKTKEDAINALLKAEQSGINKKKCEFSSIFLNILADKSIPEKYRRIMLNHVKCDTFVNLIKL